MSKIKIAFLAPEFMPVWGGVGVYSIELVKELSKYKDLDIVVITPKRGEKYTEKDIESMFDNKIKVNFVGSANDTFFYNYFFQIKLLFEFSELHKKYCFDLVHCANLTQMPDIFLQLFNKLKIPTLCTVHTTIDSQVSVSKRAVVFSAIKNGEPVEILSRFAYPYIKLLQQMYLKKQKNFIAVSKFISFYLPSEKNTVIINNGIDQSNYNAKNITVNNSELLGISKIEKPIILYTGRLLYMKGLVTYMKAIEIVAKQKDAYFVFAGPGNINKWKKMLKNVSGKNYCFLGAVDKADMPFIYSKADIFVLPSLTESFPYSIIEAMTAGLPIISTNVGGIPELIKDTETGLLVSPENENALADAMLKLLNSRHLSQKLGKNAFNYAKENLSSELMAKKTREAYYSILKK
ncbi:MAG: glycosyltransferase family 4 protein [archaeon]